MGDNLRAEQVAYLSGLEIPIAGMFACDCIDQVLNLVG